LVVALHSLHQLFVQLHDSHKAHEANDADDTASASAGPGSSACPCLISRTHIAIATREDACNIDETNVGNQGKGRDEVQPKIERK
jgi:hypothetical protein